MAAPVKLNFRRLSLRETAKRLGISRARAEDILKIVDVVPSGKKSPASGGRHRKTTATRVQSSKKFSTSALLTNGKA